MFSTLCENLKICLEAETYHAEKKNGAKGQKQTRSNSILT